MKLALFIYCFSFSLYASESTILEIFNNYNECKNKKCTLKYVDGYLLKQLSSINDVKTIGKMLKASKISTFKSNIKIKGSYAALYIYNYKYENRPQIKGGVIFVYLFSKKGDLWKIYHRLGPEKIGPDLRPIVAAK